MQFWHNFLTISEFSLPRATNITHKLTFTMSSYEVKPQSIVHHIGRLGSRIAKPISKKRSRMQMQRKLAGLGKSSSGHSTIQTECDASSIMTPASISSSASLDGCLVSDDSSHADCHTVDGDDAFSFFSGIHEEELEEDEDDDESVFVTLDQNEFLLECFMTNGQSDVLFLVHFFNQETSISNDIENVLSTHILESRSRCECRRIDSKGAPLFTAKLQIDPEQPTIVAIKNGKVLSKVSDISSSDCAEVTQWLTRTRILQTNAATDTFTGVSTIA